MNVFDFDLYLVIEHDLELDLNLDLDYNLHQLLKIVVILQCHKENLGSTSAFF